MIRFDPTSFFQRTENVALHVAASELFGWLNRSLDLPPQWAAMVTRKTGEQQVVRAGGRLDGDEAEDVLFTRVTPVDVEIREEGIKSHDGFMCDALVRLRLSVVPERGELASFMKSVLGSRRVAQAAGLASFLQPIIATTLSYAAAERDAADLIDARSTDTLSKLLTDALKGPCFSGGFALERAPVARFDSDAFREVRETQERVAARKAEHEATLELNEALGRAREEHVENLSKVLTRLKDLAEASPQVELPELIRTFSHSQRSQIYEALFANDTPTAETQWIVAAAGDELLFFRPGGGDRPERRLKVSGEAGPVRSIRATQDSKAGAELLVGGATGVYLWPVDRAAPTAVCLLPEAPAVRGGFNSVTKLNGRIYASHSELGLCQWEEGEPRKPQQLLRDMTRESKAVRCADSFGGLVYCSIDEKIVAFHPPQIAPFLPRGEARDDQPDIPLAQVFTGSRSLITAICVTEDGLFAGNSDGDVLYWRRGQENDPEVLHHGMNRAAESLWMLATHGVKRLVFTDTSLSVHASVLGDNFRCEYEAGGQTLRRVEVAPDLLVATTDLRDRMICWDPAKPDEPQCVLPVSRLCGHSIQDICLVTT